MATFQLQSGPVPLHHQVYLDLRACAGPRRVAVGRSTPDGARARGPLRLQPDHRPARARRARPRGTDRADPWPGHVRDPTVDPARHGRLAQLRRRDGRPGPRGRDASRRLADRARPASTVAAALGIEPGAPTLYVERLRLADDEPLLLEQVHLPADRFPGLARARTWSTPRCTSSWPAATTPTWRCRARRSCRSRLPAREARLLGQEPNRLALLVEGVAYTRSGIPVEYARSYVRGDRLRYHVEREIARSSRLAEVDRRASGRATRE